VKNFKKLKGSKMKDINFKYEFIGQGSKVNPKHICPNTQRIKKNIIYLDVGNALEQGMIDHHQLSVKRIAELEESEVYHKCVAGLVIAHPSLILNNLASDQEGSDEITIVVHQNPDFDCFDDDYFLINTVYPNDINIYLDKKMWHFHFQQLSLRIDSLY